MTQRFKTWWIDVNEWLDERDECMSGMAVTQSWLDEMEMTSHKMTLAIEASAVAELVRAVKQIMWINECRCGEAWTKRNKHEPSALCGELDELAEVLAKLPPELLEMGDK